MRGEKRISDCLDNHSSKNGVGMLDESLITLLGRRALHETRSQDTVDWAVQEIVAGRDTPELCVLAGMSAPLNAFEVDAQFQKTLDERGIVPPDEATCLRLYARQIAQALLDSKIPIPIACQRLYRIYCDSYDSEYFIWEQLEAARNDITADGISLYFYEFALTPDNFDAVVRLEARKFLSEP